VFARSATGASSLSRPFSTLRYQTQDGLGVDHRNDSLELRGARLLAQNQILQNLPINSSAMNKLAAFSRGLRWRW
jgi:hypothetical protein